MNNVLHIIGKNIHDLTLNTCNNKHEEPFWLTFFTRRILVKDRGMIHVIPLADIVYLQAQSNYTCICTIHRKILNSKTLKYWCGVISHEYFHRVHHSFLINQMYVGSISKADNLLTMTNGDIVPVSRRYNRNSGVFADTSTLILP